MSTSSKKSLLYIVNFYGSPPLNYFEKYLKDNNLSELTIVKLPAIRLMKGKTQIEAFIKDEREKVHKISMKIPIPLPNFAVFLIQYLLNFIILFILLRKIKRKHFDLAIGETNFGSAISFLLRKLKIVRYSIYFNGDILPDANSSRNCFFLPNKSSLFNKLYKFADTCLLKLQIFLRKIGYKNDLVWYGNGKIKIWDEHRGLISKDNIIYDPILIDLAEFTKYSKYKKDLNKLAYIGRIDDYVGLDMIIPALEQIRKKIPKIELHIVGGSDISFEKYKKLAEKFQVRDRIIFHGFLPNMKDALEIISKCAIGLALYKPTTDNVSMFSQPAKPKEYIKVGIPVLVTENGPEIGQQIIKSGAGVGSKFEVDSAAQKIISALSDKKMYNLLKNNVEKYAKMNDYSKIFNKVWNEILIRN